MLDVAGHEAVVDVDGEDGLERLLELVVAPLAEHRPLATSSLGQNTNFILSLGLIPFIIRRQFRKNPTGNEPDS